MTDVVIVGEGVDRGGVHRNRVVDEQIVGERIIEERVVQVEVRPAEDVLEERVDCRRDRFDDRVELGPVESPAEGEHLVEVRADRAHVPRAVGFHDGHARLVVVGERLGEHVDEVAHGTLRHHVLVRLELLAGELFVDVTGVDLLALGRHRHASVGVLQLDRRAIGRDFDDQQVDRGVATRPVAGDGVLGLLEVELDRRLVEHRLGIVDEQRRIPLQGGCLTRVEGRDHGGEVERSRGRRTARRARPPGVRRPTA